MDEDIFASFGSPKHDTAARKNSIRALMDDDDADILFTSSAASRSRTTSFKTTPSSSFSAGNNAAVAAAAASAVSASPSSFNTKKTSDLFSISDSGDDLFRVKSTTTSTGTTATTNIVKPALNELEEETPILIPSAGANNANKKKAATTSASLTSSIFGDDDDDDIFMGSSATPAKDTKFFSDSIPVTPVEPTKKEETPVAATKKSPSPPPTVTAAVVKEEETPEPAPEVKKEEMTIPAVVPVASIAPIKKPVESLFDDDDDWLKPKSTVTKTPSATAISASKSLFDLDDDDDDPFMLGSKKPTPIVEPLEPTPPKKEETPAPSAEPIVVEEVKQSVVEEAKPIEEVKQTVIEEIKREGSESVEEVKKPDQETKPVEEVKQPVEETEPAVVEETKPAIDAAPAPAPVEPAANVDSNKKEEKEEEEKEEETLKKPEEVEINPIVTSVIQGKLDLENDDDDIFGASTKKIKKKPPLPVAKSQDPLDSLLSDNAGTATTVTATTTTTPPAPMSSASKKKPPSIPPKPKTSDILGSKHDADQDISEIFGGEASSLETIADKKKRTKDAKLVSTSLSSSSSSSSTSPPTESKEAAAPVETVESVKETYEAKLAALRKDLNATVQSQTSMKKELDDMSATFDIQEKVIEQEKSKNTTLSRQLQESNLRVEELNKSLAFEREKNTLSKKEIKDRENEQLKELEETKRELTQQLAKSKETIADLEKQLLTQRAEVEQERRSTTNLKKHVEELKTQLASASTTAATSPTPPVATKPKPTPPAKPQKPILPAQNSYSNGATSPSNETASAPSTNKPPLKRPKSALFEQFEKSGVIMGFGAPKPAKLQGGGTSATSSPEPSSSSNNTPTSATTPESDDFTTLSNFTRTKGPSRRPPSMYSGSLRGQDALLFWCQQRTSDDVYAPLKIENFTTNWADGLALCALMHSYDNDAISYQDLKPENRRENFELALTVGEKLGVTAVLNLDDLLVFDVPDKQTMVNYLSAAFAHLRNRS